MGHRISSALRLTGCLALLGAATAVGTTVGAGPAAADPPVFRVVPSPNGHLPESSLLDVACVSTASCVAVGATQGGPTAASDTLVESWNGRSWSVVASPNAMPDDILEAVSCATTRSCMAVGSAGPLFNERTESPITESWDGRTWSLVALPEPVGTTSIALNAVSCPAVDECLAVGSSSSEDFNYGHPEELVEAWDGSAWRILPPALTPVTGAASRFTSVSCAGPGACVAAGDVGSYPDTYPLVESWNGSTWTEQRTAELPIQDQGPDSQGITCVTEATCVLAGGLAYYRGYFFERWNAGAWTLIDNANPSDAATPSSVSCGDAGHCLAVGPVQTIIAGSFPVAFVYTDGQWSTVPTAPVPSPTFDAEIFAVSCLRHGPCTAVGSDGVDSGHTLVETTPSA